MKWLKTKLYKWVLEAGRAEENSFKLSRSDRAEVVSTSDESWGDGLRIHVKKVIGGFVVSFRYYDSKTDRHNDRHYLITDDQDFNAELGKTITMESMRQS